MMMMMINAKNTQRLGKLLALFSTPDYEVTVLDATNEFKLVVIKNGRSVQLRNDVNTDAYWIDIYEHKPSGFRLNCVRFDQVKETVDQFLSDEVQFHRAITFIYQLDDDLVDEYVTGIYKQRDGSIKVLTRTNHIIIKRTVDGYKCHIAGSSEEFDISELENLFYQG
jgi:hypothetical protein